MHSALNLQRWFSVEWSPVGGHRSLSPAYKTFWEPHPDYRHRSLYGKLALARGGRQSIPIEKERGVLPVLLCVWYQNVQISAAAAVLHGSACITFKNALQLERPKMFIA